ncbi:glutathione peroxidase [bacterium]|nr:glutathione peroxidase [bacterium]
MKILLLAAGLLIVLGVAFSLWFLRSSTGGDVQEASRGSGEGFWELDTITLEGDPVSLDRWRGQVALVVNVASKCGFTPQYEGLMELQRAYSARGFTVLAFPSNDFLGQEPGTSAEIRAFCDAEYGVAFPLFAKTKVKGAGRDPVYRFLTGSGLEEPTWNFTKYLVSREGRVLYRFPPKMEPGDAELLARIETALDS